MATYETVGLGEVWPGVRLSLRAYGANVEKVFTVEPGADPTRIRMRVAGARSLRVNEAGALVAKTGLGEVTFTRPIAYQERGGVRRAVTVAYRAKDRQYGFSVIGHDPTLPVVIDPLLQATYLGGSGGSDSARAIAIHPSTGEVFVTGTTDSTDFPGTAGGARPSFGGGHSDVFVARFNAGLTSLIQATYLGGSGLDSDSSSALAIHPTTGEVFVTGATDSTDFSGTIGGAQPAYGGGSGDAFVARLNATLTTLRQATYLGGSGADGAVALAIDPITGEVFVTGFTDSTDFPGTTGGAQPAFGGSFDDAFVARFNPTLTVLSQATYLGGGSCCQLGGIDYGTAVVIHPTSGEVFVAGHTASTDFPGTAGGAQPVSVDNGGLGGLGDGFVARLNAALTTLIQATYLGGIGVDVIGALAIHPTTGEVFVAGDTDSTDFPGTAGGAQPKLNGGADAFVARFNASLTTLIQATYLGGSRTDAAIALVIDPILGDVFVAGHTASTDFPGTAGGAQPVFGGGPFGRRFDAFLARLTSDLKSQVIVDDLVTLSPVVTSFNPTSVAAGPAGTFTITATFTNTSSTSIHDPVFKVAQLSNGNLLLNADGGPGGVGAKLTPDVGADKILGPGESFTTKFVVGLQQRSQFTFFVDLWGETGP